MLFFIFLVALLIRFLYFPGNIYFGYDQARDAFAANEILAGDVKIVGPTTSYPGLNHGSLYYYLYAPFYYLGAGDPSYVAAFLRVVNATGIFLIFILSVILFNRYVGLIAAYLFAISFEQSQFAMYLNHPSFAVISILTMFTGLSILAFQKRKIGLLVSLLGLGLSFQFEFILIYLTLPFTAILLYFRKNLSALNTRTMLAGLLVFLAAVSTYLMVELKYGFRSLGYVGTLLAGGSDKLLYQVIRTYLFEIGQMIKFNLSGSYPIMFPVALLLLVALAVLIRNSAYRKQLIFLSIWFFSAAIVYFVSGGTDINAQVIQYHQNAGVSLALIIFVSFIIYLLGKKSLPLAAVLILLITTANVGQIQKLNPFGSMPEINAQSYMLLSDEKKVLDYMYKDSQSAPFAVKAVTMPFYVNTTWSYLFEWYGQKKYGYLPIWGGKNALGYPGNLVVQEAQDKLPDRRYLIIEPLRGIPTHMIAGYLQEEDYFSTLVREVKIGEFILQVREKK